MGQSRNQSWGHSLCFFIVSTPVVSQNAVSWLCPRIQRISKSPCRSTTNTTNILDNCVFVFSFFDLPTNLFFFLLGRLGAVWFSALLPSTQIFISFKGIYSLQVEIMSMCVYFRSLEIILMPGGKHTLRGVHFSDHSQQGLCGQIQHGWSEMQTSTLHLRPSESDHAVSMHHTQLKACWKPRHASSFTCSTLLIWVEQFQTYLEQHLGIPDAIQGVQLVKCLEMNFQHWSQKQRVVRVHLFLNVLIVVHPDKKKDFTWRATDVIKREIMKKKKETRQRWCHIPLETISGSECSTVRF